MKKLLFVAVFHFALFSTNAQNLQLYNGYAGLSPGWSSNYFGKTDVNGSQFLYPSWEPGSITTTSNETISDKYLLLIDKVEQKLFIKTKDADSTSILLTKKGQINYFVINTTEPHLFVLSSKYGIANKNNFLEVLVKNDSAYALLKLVTTKFVRADTHNMLDAINGNTKSSFVDEISYFISYKNGGLQKVNLTEKSFGKALSNKKLIVQNYLSQNDKHIKNEQFYIDLVQAVNN